MPGNSFGQLFKITTAGESHGGAIGVIVDGCPPGLGLSEADIQIELDRRKPGQSSATSPRQEADIIHIFSGVSDGFTTGTPILLLAYNQDARSSDYEKLKNVFRPGHADFSYEKKYGRREWRGGGRGSARETLARVAAGAIAQKYLREKLGIEFVSYVEQIGEIASAIDFNLVTRRDIEKNIMRCPDEAAAKKMMELVGSVRQDHDSIGGIIRGVIRHVPAGLGEPVFDKLPADLGKAMLSINAVKGFEIGLGFDCVKMRGSKHNDEFFIDATGQTRTKTNNAGGTLGGITSGETIYFRVVFKPVATVGKVQETGRHDSCVLPRAVPIVDAMGALVIMDHYLRHKAQNG